VIKYLGSKRVFVPLIVEVVRRLCPEGAILDPFSGTARVGHALKAAGYRVIASDLNAYAATLATCYVAADREDHADEAAEQLAALSKLSGRPGWFTRTYCEESRFFQPKNGARIEAIREAIEAMAPDTERRAVLLTALMEAADRVDSTTGVQMAYLKRWAPRSHNELALRLPDLLPRARGGKGEAHCLDALEAVRRFSADVCYLDPPYNQHKYLGNYHIWETLVRWDRPEVYGVARKRVACRARKSPFNSRREAAGAFAALVDAIEAPHLVVSFSDEGFLERGWLVERLARRGEVVVLEREHARYVGARIGIYNQAGRKVGRVGRVRNTEYLFVVSENRSALDAVRALARPPARGTEGAPARLPA
jgi:adenine-specific DNA-methyltransferase